MHRTSVESPVTATLSPSESEEPSGSLFLSEKNTVADVLNRKRLQAEQDGLNVIELNEQVLENNDAIIKEIREYLMEVFGSRIEENNAGLALTMINKHDIGHTRRVAAGVAQLGEILEVPKDHLAAAVHGAEFHDVGYHFPHGFTDSINQGGLDPADFGKTHQDDHPRLGAELVSGAVRSYQVESDTESKLADWDDEVLQTLNWSVLHHSNGSAYNPEEVSVAGKLARLFDKLDNDQQRSTPLQIEMFRAAAEGQSPEEIWNTVRTNVDALLAERNSAEQNPQEVVRERLSTLDEYYHHRLVPYAITDQFVTYNAATGEMEAHYGVAPSLISEKFGMPYSAEDHMADFDTAYVKSMGRASEVISSIRERTLGIVADDIPFKVVFHYADGTQAEKEYKPLLK